MDRGDNDRRHSPYHRLLMLLLRQMNINVGVDQQLGEFGREAVPGIGRPLMRQFGSRGRHVDQLPQMTVQILKTMAIHKAVIAGR